MTLSRKNRLFGDVAILWQKGKTYGRTSCLEVACVTFVHILLVKAIQMVESEIRQAGRVSSSDMACPYVNGVMV